MACLLRPLRLPLQLLHQPPLLHPAPAPVVPVPAAPAAPAIEKVSFAADAFFDFDKAVLKPEGKAKLDDLADKVKGHEPGSHHRHRSHRLALAPMPTTRSCRTSALTPSRTYLTGKGVEASAASTPKARAKSPARGRQQVGLKVALEEPPRRNRSGRHPRQVMH